VLAQAPIFVPMGVERVEFAGAITIDSLAEMVDEIP